MMPLIVSLTLIVSIKATLVLRQTCKIVLLLLLLVMLEKQRIQVLVGIYGMPVLYATYVLLLTVQTR